MIMTGERNNARKSSNLDAYRGDQMLGTEERRQCRTMKGQHDLGEHSNNVLGDKVFGRARPETEEMSEIAGNQLGEVE